MKKGCKLRKCIYEVYIGDAKVISVRIEMELVRSGKGSVTQVMRVIEGLGLLPIVKNVSL